MYLSPTILLTLLQSVLIISAMPILRTANAKGPKTTLFERQENFGSQVDNGALYVTGSVVEGANAWRDDSGVYHDITRRGKRDSRATRQTADVSYVGNNLAAEADRRLWSRAQEALLAIVKRENPKREEERPQEPLKVAEREIVEQPLADAAAPQGILKALDKGEKVYFEKREVGGGILAAPLGVLKALDAGKKVYFD